MNSRIVLIICMVVITSIAFGQSRKTKKKRSGQTATQQPTALNPQPQENYAPRPSRKPSDGPTFEAEQKYYERMAALEKVKRKNEKLLARPQYSDPTYFGHKRPPKKRKPGKMKYCRECGIRH